ncbi:MAG: response regulator [Desulfobacterales bacterium]|nr:response regulator [Desulfobacterales bacterium]
MSIKIILIDDEYHALRELAFFIKSYPELEISGMFINPLEALDQITELMPDVVFLDINMPQMQGIDCASAIFDRHAAIDIIFVTAYNEYAIEAFELNALDYILKPLSEARFSKTIARIILKQNQKKTIQIQCTNSDKRLKIQCLGNFQILWDKQASLRWRTQKNRELCAFLFHNREKEISKETIIDTLFTDIDPEAASAQLYSGIYYIRKTLEAYGVCREQICISGKYCVNMKDVDIDRAIFEQPLTGLETLAELENRARLYRGDYFEGEEWLWVYADRQKLSKFYCQLLLKIAHEHIKRKAYNNAENCLLKAFDKEPYDENTTLLIMELYLTTKQRKKAKNHFLTYEKLLKQELDIKPDNQIIRIYKSI